jgi:hypothetical protein
MSELIGIANTKDWLAATEGIPIFAYMMPLVTVGITVGVPLERPDSTECL